MSMVPSTARRMRVMLRHMIAASRAGIAVVSMHYLLVICSLAISMMVTVVATIRVLTMLPFIMMADVTMVSTIIMVAMMVSIVMIIAIIAMIVITIVDTVMVVTSSSSMMFTALCFV